MRQQATRNSIIETNTTRERKFVSFVGVSILMVTTNMVLAAPFQSQSLFSSLESNTPYSEHKQQNNLKKDTNMNSRMLSTLFIHV